MRLALPDGSQISPAGATAVLSKLQKPQQHFWPTFLLGFAGALAADSASDEARTDRQADYRRKELQEATSFVMEFGLPGLGFKETPAKSEAEKKDPEGRLGPAA